MNEKIVYIKLSTTGLDKNKDSVVRLEMKKYEKNLYDLSSNEYNITYFDKLYKPKSDFFSEELKTKFLEDLRTNKFEIQEDLTSIEILNDKKDFADDFELIRNFISNSTLIGFSIKRFSFQFMLNKFLEAGKYLNFLNIKIIDVQEDFINLFHPSSFEFLKTFISSDKLDYFGQMEDMVNFLNPYFNITQDSTYMDFSKNILKNDGKPILEFGNKHKGKFIRDIIEKDKSYYNWMITDSNIESDSKICLVMLNKMYNDGRL